MRPTSRCVEERAVHDAGCFGGSVAAVGGLRERGDCAGDGGVAVGVGCGVEDGYGGGSAGWGGVEDDGAGDGEEGLGEGRAAGVLVLWFCGVKSWEVSWKRYLPE